MSQYQVTNNSIYSNIGRDKHKNAFAKIENNKNVQPIIHKNSKMSDFNYDLCNALAVKNISMNELNNNVLDLFINFFTIKVFHVNQYY